MEIIRSSDFITDEQKAYIDGMLDALPMDLNLSLAFDGKAGFVHSVLRRPEEVCDEIPAVSCYNHIDFLLGLLKNFLIATNFNGEFEILRMAINATINNGGDNIGAIHRDHEYPHRQLLICINDNFSGGGTVIYPDDGDPFTIEYEKYDGVSFDSCDHASKFPDHGVRIMAVYTYKIRGEHENRS